MDKENLVPLFTAAPSPPQNVKVAKVIKNSAHLEWSLPVSDGGSKIRRYTIWKRVEMTDDWIKVANVETYKTNFTIPNLDFGVAYIFGVTAENDVGVSDKGVTDSGVNVEKPKGKLKNKMGLKEVLELFRHYSKINDTRLRNIFYKNVKSPVEKLKSYQ